MFNREDTFDVTIKRAVIAESKFNDDPDSFDVCIQVEAEDGQADWWRGEVSRRYGRGNLATKTQAQITLDALEKVGLPGRDLAKLNELVGKTTTAVVKATVKNNVCYYNVQYLGASNALRKLDLAEATRRLSALMDTSGPTSTAADTEPNPFV